MRIAPIFFYRLRNSDVYGANLLFGMAITELDFYRFIVDDSRKTHFYACMESATS
jgi:hypothetical protein